MKYETAISELRAKFDFRSNFLFDELSEEEENLVKSMLEPIQFKKGDKLFYEDGVPTGVFLINHGMTKKYKSVIGNQEQIFYIYTNGDLLGYHALLSNERYQDSCEAIEDTDADFISTKNFLQLQDELPKLKENLVRNLAHEFGVLANTIGVLAQKNQNSRLALFLLTLESRYEKFMPSVKGIGMSRFDLANLIGATRESLGRVLKEFKDQGLISIESKKIRIEDHNRLYEVLEKGGI